MEGEEVYFIGDVVRVVEDMSVVHQLQKDGPGWVDELALVSILIMHCQATRLQ